MDNLNQPSSTQNQPTTEQQQSISLKSSSHAKTLFIALVFFILLFVSLTTFILGSRTKPTSQPPPSSISQPTPTPDPTANWKTYVNSKYGYSFKYPSNYRFIENSSEIVRVAEDPLGSEGISVVSQLDNRFVDYNSLDTCEKVYEQIKINPGVRPSCLDSGTKYGQIQDITIVKLNGADVRSYYLTNTGFGGTTHIFQTVNEPILQMNSTDPNDRIFDQAISTFNFLDQEGQEGDQIVCMQGANPCPDGSYVSRQPPNCEFAKCL